MKDTSIEIIKKLKESGFEAYWAGGCVRDILMGRHPKDYDIVTSAKPEDIEQILENTIPVGKKFGVIIAVKNGHCFEVATFRSDATYTDGRRPDAVYFANPEEDAKRRDFTINGIFYDPIKKEVLDYVGGQKDIQHKIIRFIGDAHFRIQEDNLRILRAVRFKNALSFTYDKNTFDALTKYAKLIDNVSKERVKDELEKILLLPGRENAFADLDKIGVLEFIIPELNKLKNVKQPEQYHKEGDVFTHTIMSLEALPDKVTPELAWATLFHDIGKPETFSVDKRIRFNGHAEKGAEITEKIAKRLRFSRNLRENVVWLVRHHMMIGDVLKMRPAHQYHWIHNSLFPELLELLRADALGAKPKDLSLYNDLKRLLDQKEELLPEPKKLLTGEDVKKILGISDGPQVGEMLKDLHSAQIEGVVNTRNDAINYLKKRINK